MYVFTYSLATKALQVHNCTSVNEHLNRSLTPGACLTHISPTNSEQVN